MMSNRVNLLLIHGNELTTNAYCYKVHLHVCLFVCLFVNFW